MFSGTLMLIYFYSCYIHLLAINYLKDYFYLLICKISSNNKKSDKQKLQLSRNKIAQSINKKIFICDSSFKINKTFENSKNFNKIITFKIRIAVYSSGLIYQTYRKNKVIDLLNFCC